MDAAEAASTLVELTRLESQVTELRIRVAAHATQQTRAGAARTVRLSRVIIRAVKALPDGLDPDRSSRPSGTWSPRRPSTTPAP